MPRDPRYRLRCRVLVFSRKYLIDLRKESLQLSEISNQTGKEFVH